MPQETSSAEVWETRRAKASRLAQRRLLVSVPLFFLSVGIKQGACVSNKAAAMWCTWFLSAVLAILACVFAAEAAHCMQRFEKTDEMSFVSAVARAMMWFAVFWIGYLALAVYVMIAPAAH